MMSEYEEESTNQRETLVEERRSKYSKTRRYCCVIVLWLYLLLAYCDRYSLSGILSEIKIVFDIGNTGVAVLQTSFIITYMGCAPLIGYYGDRYERKYMFVCALILQIVSNVAGSMVRERFWILLATRCLLGISECVVNVLAFPFISDLFNPTVRVYIIQLMVTSVPIGSGLGYIIGSWASSHFGGWWYVLWATIPFTATVLLLMVFILPSNLERGAMEPEIAKTAFGYKEDLKHICRVRTYLSVCVGCVCSQIVTGAATVFFPDFVSSAAVLQGVVVPCSQPPCEYSEIIFRFGQIAIFAGFAGAAIAAAVSKIGRQVYKNPLVDAEICAGGCFIASFSVFMITAFCNYSLTIGWWFSALCLIGLSINWGLSIELVISVIPPNRRNTAKAFFNLVSHSFGDAPSPLVVGGLSDLIHKYEYDSFNAYLFDFKSLQKSMMIVAVPTCLVGGIAFFDASLHLLKDQAKITDKKSVPSDQYYENNSFSQIPLEQLFPNGASLAVRDDESSSTLPTRPEA